MENEVIRRLHHRSVFYSKEEDNLFFSLLINLFRPVFNNLFYFAFSIVAIRI